MERNLARNFVLRLGNSILLSSFRSRPDLYQKAQNIFLEIGKFLQIEDDFLGCFGDPKVTGKKGNDVAQGKCSWLVVVAMQRANREQKMIIKVRGREVFLLHMCVRNLSSLKQMTCRPWSLNVHVAAVVVEKVR